jgi:hypothetical protein
VRPAHGLAGLRDRGHDVSALGVVDAQQLEIRSAFIRRVFGRYVSDGVVDALLEEPEVSSCAARAASSALPPPPDAPPSGTVAPGARAHPRAIRSR